MTGTAVTRRGLVLGGGGVLGGAWMTGALDAIREVDGVDPAGFDVMVGTSAGSFLAALLGSGAGVDGLVDLYHGRRPAGLPPDAEYERDSGGPLPMRPRLRLGSPRLLAQTVRNTRSLNPNTALAALMPEGRGSLGRVRQVVEQWTPPGAWCPHPAVWVTALEYDSGSRVVFGRDGAPPIGLSDAVVASCSIPGWFEPLAAHGRRYVDGGAWSVANADVVAGQGLDEVYVVVPMASLVVDRPRSLFARLERRWRRMNARRVLAEIASVRAEGTRVTLITPGAQDLRAMGSNLMDARRRLKVLEVSLRTSRDTLRDARRADLPAIGELAAEDDLAP